MANTKVEKRLQELAEQLAAATDHGAHVFLFQDTNSKTERETRAPCELGETPTVTRVVLTTDHLAPGEQNTYLSRL